MKTQHIFQQTPIKLRRKFYSNRNQFLLVVVSHTRTTCVPNGIKFNVAWLNLDIMRRWGRNLVKIENVSEITHKFAMIQGHIEGLELSAVPRLTRQTKCWCYRHQRNSRCTEMVDMEKAPGTQKWQQPLMFFPHNLSHRKHSHTGQNV